MLRTAGILVALTASLVALAPSADAARCEPAVRVDGDDDLVREVARDLVIHGIKNRAAPDCPVVLVHVEPGPHSIRVVITDPYGTSERSVGAAGTASALAASWAEQLVASAPPNLTASTTRVSEIAPDHEPPPIWGGISLLYEMAVDANHVRWMGGAITGCVEVGPVCLGGLGRVETGTFTGHESRLVPVLTGGTGFDLLATIAMPVRLGKLVITPELDVGFGAVDLGWVFDTRYPPNDSSVRAARVGARLAGARPIGDGFAIEAALSVEAMPANYVRYDDDLPPIRRFEINPFVRLALGIRH